MNTRGGHTPKSSDIPAVIEGKYRARKSAPCCRPSCWAWSIAVFLVVIIPAILFALPHTMDIIEVPIFPRQRHAALGDKPVWLWTRYLKKDASSNFAAQFDWEWSRTGIRSDTPNPRTIYVKTDYLGKFEKEMLPKVSESYPIILVTGDSDYSSPCDDLTPNCRYLDLLDNPRVEHWFAENMDLIHPKVSPLPLGINTKGTGQMDQFNVMVLGMKPFFEKPAKVYANFQFNLNDCKRYPHCRSLLHNDLKGKDWIHFEPNRVSEGTQWRRHTDFAFVMSPHGNGLDCFRTWEAILLDSVPIVESSSLDSMYKGFPVVTVKDFRHITQEMLDFWKHHFRYAFTDEMKTRLLMSSWVQRIKAFPREEDKWK